jgi:hypothetical protein
MKRQIGEGGEKTSWTEAISCGDENSTPSATRVELEVGERFVSSQSTPEIFLFLRRTSQAKYFGCRCFAHHVYQVVLDTIKKMDFTFAAPLAASTDGRFGSGESGNDDSKGAP